MADTRMLEVCVNLDDVLVRGRLVTEQEIHSAFTEWCGDAIANPHKYDQKNTLNQPAVSANQLIDTIKRLRGTEGEA